MNCRPGDLAIVIAAPPRNPQLLGTIVKVLQVSLCVHFEEFGSWPGCRIRPPRPAWDQVGKLSDTGWIQEWRLRPIRDPGARVEGVVVSTLPLELELVPS